MNFFSAIYTKSNVIFLDFDGVCNSFETGSYLTHTPDQYGVDPKIMDRINDICVKTDARIVISSNWRRFEPDGSYRFNKNWYKNPIMKLVENLGHHIAGCLPLDRHITKSEALQLWFEDHPDFEGNYAILDDDEREGFQHVPRFKKNFWLTDMRYGVTDSIKNEIIKHFTD